MISKKLLFILHLLLYSLCVLGQSDNNLIKKSTQHPIEKVYIHFDKSSYFPGDTIWYKIYVTVNNSLPTEEDSKTVYTNFFDAKRNIIETKSAPFDSRGIHGQFPIPANFEDSHISVVGFTKWMLNFDQEFLYTKTIQIINRDYSRSKKTDSSIPTISFFPESGNLVDNILTKVAFKAYDDWGDPVNVEGKIINTKGENVAEVKSKHDGMGHFMINPLPNESYFLKWMDNNATEQLSPLPKSKSSGAILTVLKRQENTLLLSYSLSNDLKNKNQQVYIVGQIHNKTFLNITKETSSQITYNTINTSELPTGIATFTLFDENWIPIAERISFINNQNFESKVEVSVDTLDLNKKGKSIFTLDLPDNEEAFLSVSISDGILEHNNTESIISYFLLSSDLKGKIHNPNYYLTQPEDIELLMLTHGWRRIHWQNLDKIVKMPFQKDSSYWYLSGQVTNLTKRKRPLKKELYLIFTPPYSKYLTIVDADLSNTGHFTTKQIVFDNTEVSYRVNTMATILPKITFDTIITPILNWSSSIPLPKTNINENVNHYQKIITHFEGNPNSILLPELKVTKKKLTPLQEMDLKYATAMYRSDFAKSFDVQSDHLSRTSLSILHYIATVYPKMQVGIKQGEYSAIIFGDRLPPIFMLNETRSSEEIVSRIPVTDIAYVKIFDVGMNITSSSENRVIAIYTKNGIDFTNSTIPSKMTKEMAMGYSYIKEFFHPNYEEQLSGIKDLRTTLYWNPIIQITKGQKKQISFFNNDVSKSLRVIIEGVTTEGKFVSKQILLTQQPQNTY